MEPKKFTEMQFAWLRQVAADPTVSAQAFKAGYFIACHYLNGKTLDAWPSQQTLAGQLGLGTSKGVRYLIDQLVDGGHLSVTVAHGRGSTNRYRIILKEIAAQNDPDETDPDHPIAEATSKNAKSSTTETTLFPDDLPPAKAKGPQRSAIDESFDIWWQQYPKKIEKAAARKAYHRIVSKGEASSEELLFGVMKYAAGQTGKDAKYIKYPQGWLNGARWTDEPDPAPSVQFGASSRSQQPRRSYIDIALEGLQRDEQE
jgi:hypothetical protein